MRCLLDTRRFQGDEINDERNHLVSAGESVRRVQYAARLLAPAKGGLLRGDARKHYRRGADVRLALGLHGRHRLRAARLHIIFGLRGAQEREERDQPLSAGRRGVALLPQRDHLFGHRHATGRDGVLDARALAAAGWADQHNGGLRLARRAPCSPHQLDDVSIQRVPRAA